MAKEVVKVSEEAKQRSRWAEFDQVVIEAAKTRDGIVLDKVEFAPFEGEIVLHHNLSRQGGSFVKKFYYAPTFIAALLAHQQKIAQEQGQSRSHLAMIDHWRTQLGFYNFLTPDQWSSVLQGPADLAREYEKARDFAKQTAGQMLSRAGQPLDSLRRLNPSSNLAVLTGASNRLAERQQHLEQVVLPINLTRFERWGAKELARHDQLVEQMRKVLQWYPDPKVAYEHLGKWLNQVTLKPWMFFKHFVNYVRNPKLDWTTPRDQNHRLLGALFLEGMHTDLLQLARLAPHCADWTDDQVQLYCDQVQRRIDLIASLPLPQKFWAHSKNQERSKQYGYEKLSQRLIACLKNLLYEVRERRPEAAKTDFEDLAWHLRYRALPSGQAEEFKLWHGSG